MQSPVISFVSVSSPMYWPSNLAKPCAHATLPSPVPSRRPSRRHLSISFFPMIKADGEIIEGTCDETVQGYYPHGHARKEVRQALLADPYLFHGDFIQYIVDRPAS